jgi:chromosome partitioning protein
MTDRPIVLTIANGKGGVGKTSVAVNLAAGSAERGIPTLLVDLDPQGNTALDLGVYDHDAGRSFGAAVSYDVPLAPMRDIRRTLDYVPAGEGTASLHAVLSQAEAKNGAYGLAKLRDVLWQQTAYHLVVIDTPPAHSNRPIIDAAFIASDWVLIPTRHDAGSILGIAGVVERLREVVDRKYSDAQPLGVVLFGLAAASKALRADAAAELEAGLGDIPLLKSTIRTSERAAYDLRDRGKTATEYALDAKSATGDRLKALRLRRTRDLQRFASGAQELADDYSALLDEVLATMGFQAAPAVTS